MEDNQQENKWFMKTIEGMQGSIKKLFDNDTEIKTSIALLDKEITVVQTKMIMIGIGISFSVSLITVGISLYVALAGGK